DAPPGGEVEPAEARVPDAHLIWLAELKARALFGAGLFAAAIEFAKLGSYQELLQHRWLGIAHDRVVRLPEQLLGWYHPLAARLGWGLPSILGPDIRQLAIAPTLDLSMFGAGGLIGLRTATGLLVGCLANWFVLAPLMIHAGEIVPKPDGTFGRTL